MIQNFGILVNFKDVCQFLFRDMGTFQNIERDMGYQGPPSRTSFKAAYSVTMNIFRKFLISFKIICKGRNKLFFTIKMFSTAENCMEK